MMPLARLIVWTLGALSMAVLLRLAVDPWMLPPPLQMLEAYDAAVRAAFAWAEPLLAPHLPLLYERIGAGTQLQPHWPHVFLIAAFAMAPRLERDPGLGAAASFTLRLAQAVAAIILALIVTTYVGTAPFLQANATANFIAAIFVASALAINVVDDFFDALGDDERSDAQPQTGERSRWLSFFIIAVGVTLVFIALIAGMLHLTDVATTQRNVWTVFIFALVISWAFAVWADNSSPDDELMFKRGFLAAPLTMIVRFILLFAFIVIATAPQGPIMLRRGGLFVAVVLLAAFLGGRKIADLVLRREGERLPPPPSALGVFLLGGGGLLIAQSWLG